MREYTGELPALLTDLEAEVLAASDTGRGIRLIGFAGAPGAGKSTATQLFADRLRAHLHGAKPLFAGLAPMDGFHKSNDVLREENLLEEKGSPNSFDIVGFLMTLDRIHAGKVAVYTPRYDRELHVPIAAAYRVEPTGLAVTEGNYLALQDGPYALLREQIDLLIYLDVPDELRRSRLLNRRLEKGEDRATAEKWISRVDAANAVLVKASAPRCDRVWHLQQLPDEE